MSGVIFCLLAGAVNLWLYLVVEPYLINFAVAFFCFGAGFANFVWVRRQ